MLHRIIVFVRIGHQGDTCGHGGHESNVLLFFEHLDIFGQVIIASIYLIFWVVLRNRERLVALHVISIDPHSVKWNLMFHIFLDYAVPFFVGRIAKP